VAVASGGLIRDGVSSLASRDVFGPSLADPATGYGAVYLIEIALLFATLIAVGPLVGAPASTSQYAKNPVLI
jgi:BCD family chlorophyll transporter-like MFS transporter